MMHYSSEIKISLDIFSFQLLNLAKLCLSKQANLQDMALAVRNGLPPDFHLSLCSSKTLHGSRLLPQCNSDSLAAVLGLSSSYQPS